MISAEKILTPDINFNFCIAYADFKDNDANTMKDWCFACLQKLYPAHQVYLSKLTCKKVFLINTRIQAYAEARRDIRGNLVFLDTDIVACNPLPNIWVEPFDIGITKGSYDSPYNLQPFNGGMIFAQDTPGAQYFFDYIHNVCLNTMEGVYTNGWFVDQLAMGKAWDTQQDKVHFKVLNSKYNYFPDHTNDEGDDPFFMHFKGERKYFMHEYVNKVLNAAT